MVMSVREMERKQRLGLGQRKYESKRCHLRPRSPNDSLSACAFVAPPTSWPVGKGGQDRREHTEGRDSTERDREREMPGRENVVERNGRICSTFENSSRLMVTWRTAI